MSKAAPNWKMWRLIPSVRIWEAVALSCDFEPEFIAGMIDRDERGSRQFAVAEIPDEFRMRLKVATANIGHGLKPAALNMGDSTLHKVGLTDFAAFAIDCGWSLPKEFPRELLPREQLITEVDGREIDQRAENSEYYTIEDAARKVAEKYGLHEGAAATLQEQLSEAAKAGTLTVRHPHTDLPYIPETVRFFYERVSVTDLNAWFARQSVSYRLGVASKDNVNEPIPYPQGPSTESAPLVKPTDSNSTQADTTKAGEAIVAVRHRYYGPNYSPSDPNTWTSQDTVVDWLITELKLSRREAEAVDIATRPDRLRQGGRVKKRAHPERDSKG